jgi:6-phosphofructokinase 1
MSIAHRLQQRGVDLVGVPKTIDNDLVRTDRTFGFDTAVSIASGAIDRLHTTAQSHHRVMILETMGRYAGWIALHAGVATGADVILIPEFPYDIEEIAEVCRERESGGQQFTIIAVAEGAKPQGGDVTVKDHVADSPDSIRLGGVGRRIQDQLTERVRSEIRTTILGHVQRGGTPTAYDRNLATTFGYYAARMVAEKRFGEMVALQENRLQSVPLEGVADQTRTVPNDSPMLHAALALGTSFGVEDPDITSRQEPEAAVVSGSTP